MRFLKLWLPVVVFGLVVALIALLAWTLATEPGTRWLVARASRYLPAQLTLGELRGNFVDGVLLRRIDWQDEGIEITANDAFVHVELRPLLRRQVRIMRLDAASLDVRLAAGEDNATEPPQLPEIALPLPLWLAAGEVRNLNLYRGEQATAMRRVSLRGNMNGADLELAQLVVEADAFRIEARGKARFERPHPLELDVDWRWQSADATEYAGVLSIAGDSSRYALQHSLSSPFEIATTGSLSGVPLDPVVDLRNEWQSLAWPIAGDPLQAGPGTLQFSGNAGDYTVSLDTTLRWRYIPESAVTLTGSGNLESLAVSALRVTTNQGAVRASGDVAWVPAIRAEGDVEIDDVDLAFVEPLLGIRPPEEHLTGSGHVSYGGDGVGLEDARLELGANRLVASGTVGDELALSGELDFAALEQLVPEGNGAVRGSFELQGPPVQPTGRATLAAEELAWRDFAVDRLTADIAMPITGSGDMRVDLQGMEMPGGDLDAAGITLTGRYDEHSATVLLRRGDGELAFDAAGSYADGGWQGQISNLRVSSPVLHSWSSRDRAAVSASPALVSVAPLCLYAESGAACLEGSWAQDGATNFKLSIDELPLAALPIPMPAGAEVGGRLHVDASGTFAAGEISGDLNVDVLDGSVTTDYEGETVALDFATVHGAASIDRNRATSLANLETTDGIAAISATLDLDNVLNTATPINGTASIAVADAGVVAALVPGIGEIQGRLSGELDIGGSLSAPAILGEVSVNEGAFNVRQTGIQVTDVSATLRQTETGRLQLTGSARSGGGTVTIDGDTRFGPESGIRTDITIRGQDFQIARLPDWEVAASPDISVVLDDRATTVGGELEIPEARINFRSLPETAVKPSPDATVHRQGEEQPPPKQRRINVDVTASLGEQVQFAGFGLTAGVEGAVRIRGGTHDPYTGSGRLDLRDGRYEAYGQELEIEEGELLFNGPLTNPEINVRAIRKAGEVTAGIRLAGTPDNLRSDVFSEPPLSDADALAYLLTGRPLASAGTAGEGDTLSRAAFALGMSGAGTIASQVRSSLGLETLSVEGGSEDGRIIAGKRFGDRLLVEYGYGLIDKLGTLLLRYRINERLILESRTGTVGNLDIVYSVKRK